ncbi:Rad1/Rec1/Rad17 [Pilaira anomala]|nr:Rad1/Rec1/Rad17 [Pilaira anomala]
MNFQVNEDVKFFGVIRNVENLLFILKAVDISDTATFFIHSDGIVITVEKLRAVKAVAYIKSNLFYIYNIKEDEEMAPFGVSLDLISTCFAAIMPKINSSFESRSFQPILTTDNNYCELTYDGTGSTFVLRRAARLNSSIICTFFPVEPEQGSEELKLVETQETPQKIGLPAKWFEEVLEQIEPSTKYIEFTIAPNDQVFEIVGHESGDLQDFDIPQNSELIVFHACTTKLTFMYYFSHVSLCIKALAKASEVAIELYMTGAMRLVIKLVSSEQVETYVEFSFLPVSL